ncbi:MAG: YeeE/YedE family protein [bacterium]|nr:YeeE/YedE family protein [bacterium]
MNTKYMNPYLAGFLLGLLLLATIFITGRGLGASGAFKNVIIAGVITTAPNHAAQNPFYQDYVGKDKEPPLKAWLVFEVLGVLFGAFLSGLLSNRLKWTTESGPHLKPQWRWFFAALGGMLFIAGAQMARGCTSGAALSGMAVLSTAGFVTMMAIFGTGYMAAFFARRLWK